jgi:hypothetical protein
VGFEPTVSQTGDTGFSTPRRNGCHTAPQREVCVPGSSCSEDTVLIVYGLPTRELEEAAGRGELVLGGCLVSFDAPDRACENCSHEW